MSFRSAIETSWRVPNLLTVLLWPLSLLYRTLFLIKQSAYQLGLLKIYRAPIPVLIVGNLTVGGTGKTPLVIYLVEELRRQGYKPGVISRGYGGKADSYPYIVKADSPVKQSGDEPALIVRRTGVPMVVGADRQASIECLLKHSEIDIIISDDGLQHFALHRDIELCLLDATSPSQNKQLLPAGPYREPLSRLKSVDLIVEHGLTEDAAGGVGNRFAMNLSPSEPKPVNSSVASVANSVNSFDSNQAFHAVAGIGNPDRFFNTCRALGYKFTEHVFDDHHDFTDQDISFTDGQTLMTEKDAVKCQAFADQRHWYLPVDAKLSDQFNSQLAVLIAACQ